MSTLEVVGAILGALATVLLLAAIGGAIWVRFRASGEDERFKRFKDSIEALEAEVGARKITNERLETKVAAQDTKMAAQDKVMQTQQSQIQMLQHMVQGTEALALLTTSMHSRFDQVDEGIRNITALRGGTRAGEVGEQSGTG